MHHPADRRGSNQRAEAPGPGVAFAARGNRRSRAYLDAPGAPAGGDRDFLAKCRFVHKLLVAQQIPACSSDDAAAWTLAFADEGDPTFPILEWLEAGWRDPVLVSAALRVCGTRERAEVCMDQIGREFGTLYEHSVILELAEAMLLPAGAANDS